MNLKAFLIALGLGICISSVAQRGSNCPEDLIPKLGQNKQYGYVTLFGEWRIYPIYTKVSPFVENKAVVQKGLKYGVIDCDGNVILPPDYEALTNYRFGKIWAKKNGLWGLMDAKGKQLLPHQFAEINPIALTELSWVKKENLWGLFNEERGSFICKPQYKIAQIMSENATLVQVDINFGVVNHVNCNYLLPISITSVKKLAPHTITYKIDDKWGIFNDEGKIIANPDYDSVNMKYGADVLIIQKAGLYGLSTLSGRQLLAPEYTSIDDYSGGFFKVIHKGKTGYANRLGKVFIKPSFQDGSSFINKTAIVRQNEKWGIINEKGSFILKPNYSQILSNTLRNYFAIKEKGKNDSKEQMYFYDLQLKKLSEEGFDSIYVSDAVENIRVSKNGNIRYFNLATKSFINDQSYQNGGAFFHGFATVQNNDKWGVVDVKGKTILALNYDSVYFDFFSNRLIIKTINNGKLGIAESSGKILLPNEYDHISLAAPNYIKFKKDGKFGVMKTTGAIVIEPVYDHLSNRIDNPANPDWPAVAGQKGKFGLVNEKGEEVFPAKAYKIDYIGDSYFSLYMGKKVALMDSKGTLKPEAKFDEIKLFGESICAARKGDRWGYINNKLEEEIKFEFEDAGMFRQRAAAVKQNGKWGVIDHSGKFLVQPEYDEYVIGVDGERYLKKGGKEFKIKGGLVK